MPTLADDYLTYCETFNKVWLLLKKWSDPREKLVNEICEYRKYPDVNRWQMLFESVDVAKVTLTTAKVMALRKALPEDLGLFSKNGFLLDNTYMIPIRDMLGNIIALVGWEPGKKYITTPSKYFDKSSLFFGLEQFKDYDTKKQKPFFVVEGIFDSLSLRSLGFRCLGNMGIDSTQTKSKILSLASKVIAIPDADDPGQNVINTDSWYLPANGTYVKIPDYAEEMDIKDVDDIIKVCEAQDIITEFATYIKSSKRKELIELR